MRIPFITPRRREYSLEPLSVADSAAVAVLHQEDFVRPWSGDEFEALLEQDTVFGYAAREVGHGNENPVGFVLARLVAGEGEILTIAVARSHRRQGLGWQMLDAVLRELHAQRAEALFLEVDETNIPAIALYRRMGFRQVGKRPGYYQSDRGALVMRRDLR
jgi:ribosomal-protein-alanine N-acetyltransferase